MAQDIAAPQIKIHHHARCRRQHRPILPGIRQQALPAAAGLAHTPGVCQQVLDHGNVSVRPVLIQPILHITVARAEHIMDLRHHLRRAPVFLRTGQRALVPVHAGQSLHHHPGRAAQVARRVTIQNLRHPNIRMLSNLVVPVQLGGQHIPLIGHHRHLGSGRNFHHHRRICLRCKNGVEHTVPQQPKLHPRTVYAGLFQHIPQHRVGRQGLGLTFHTSVTPFQRYHSTTPHFVYQKAAKIQQIPIDLPRPG